MEPIICEIRLVKLFVSGT